MRNRKYETREDVGEDKIKISLESLRNAVKSKCDYIEMRLYRNAIISKCDYIELRLYRIAIISKCDYIEIC